MKTINIICKLNKNDNFSIPSESLEVNLTNKKHYNYTFWDTKKNNLLFLPHFFSTEGLDILYLSLFVYYADRKIKREMFPDAWTRKIKLYVPVLSLSKWEKEKNIVIRMLSFLSGDIWEIDFRERGLNDLEKKFKKRHENIEEKKNSFNKFCMLSGGLDSYIGAIDLLEESKEIAFISHYGGGKGVVTYQNMVQSSLKDEYGLTECSFYNFHAAPINGSEDTTRSRSFMFFSHAIVLASTMRKKVDLIIPENGFISLNVPLTNSRLGSSSTRTTHPYYIMLLQKLLNNLSLTIKLLNPYQFKTKGEMILECKNEEFLKNNISNTMSCSHPDNGRYIGHSEPSHCGTCFPCVIRRASTKKANIKDSSKYNDPKFLSGRTAKNNLNAYKISIKKYDMKEINIFSRIQMSGPLLDNLEYYKEIYEKGMEEIKYFINDLK